MPVTWSSSTSGRDRRPRLRCTRTSPGWGCARTPPRRASSRSWTAVHQAREAAVALMQKRLAAGESPSGAEVDGRRDRSSCRAGSPRDPSSHRPFDRRARPRLRGEPRLRGVPRRSSPHRGGVLLRRARALPGGFRNAHGDRLLHHRRPPRRHRGRPSGPAPDAGIAGVRLPGSARVHPFPFDLLRARPQGAGRGLRGIRGGRRNAPGRPGQRWPRSIPPGLSMGRRSPTSAIAFLRTIPEDRPTGAAVIIVDCSTPDRTGPLGSMIEGLPCLVIDHHSAGELRRRAVRRLLGSFHHDARAPALRGHGRGVRRGGGTAHAVRPLHRHRLLPSPRPGRRGYLPRRGAAGGARHLDRGSVHDGLREARPFSAQAPGGDAHPDGEPLERPSSPDVAAYGGPPAGVRGAAWRG